MRFEFDILETYNRGYFSGSFHKFLQVKSTASVIYFMLKLINGSVTLCSTNEICVCAMRVINVYNSYKIYDTMFFNFGSNNCEIRFRFKHSRVFDK